MEKVSHFLKAYIRFLAYVLNDFPAWDWLTPLNVLIPNTRESPSYVSHRNSCRIVSDANLLAAHYKKSPPVTQARFEDIFTRI